MPTQQQLLAALAAAEAPQEAPLPWNIPQSPIFSMFGVVGGNPQEEAARTAAEKAWDYAQAEAKRDARLADARTALGLDTPEALDKELMAPVRERWDLNPARQQIARFSTFEGPEGERKAFDRLTGRAVDLTEKKPKATTTVENLGGRQFITTIQPNGTLTRTEVKEAELDPADKAEWEGLKAGFKTAGESDDESLWNSTTTRAKMFQDKLMKGKSSGILNIRQIGK